MDLLIAQNLETELSNTKYRFMRSIGQQLFDILNFIDISDKKECIDHLSFVQQLKEMWMATDSDKYKERNSKIIIVRIINELTELNVSEEIETWLCELDKISPKSPQYAMDFLRGKVYFQLKEYDKATEYLKKSYNANKDFFCRQEQIFLKFINSDNEAR